LEIKTKIVSSHTADSKRIQQEVDGTVIFPPLVFPGFDLQFDWFGLACFANKTKIVSSHTTDSKPVKQEADGTMILPPSVFPATAISGGTEVDHLSLQPEVQGLSLSPAAGTRGKSDDIGDDLIKLFCCNLGATTFHITTLSITKFSLMTFSITTLVKTVN
jgi:hypothetical protein